MPDWLVPVILFGVPLAVAVLLLRGLFRWLFGTRRSDRPGSASFTAGQGGLPGLPPDPHLGAGDVGSSGADAGGAGGGAG